MALAPRLGAAAERSAAPDQVGRALEQLVERSAPAAEELAATPGMLDAVVAVTAASRSLTRLLLADAAALAVLADLDARTPAPGAPGAALVEWKQREMLRIAARDLLGLDPLEAIGRALADMADGVLRAVCGPAGAGLAVIAMGKLGGRELNYASDIDLLFVGEGDARAVMEVARTCFRVDADLRPEGRSGPLTRTLASYEAYWERWAQPWEFQALLKARPAAGDDRLGSAFAEAAAGHVWGRAFGAEELRQVRSMKATAEAQLARRGLTDREIKRGRGGIRDVEFAVQLLQMVHGRHDPALRRPATLDALAELAGAGYIGEDDASSLEAAYRFLRTVEHRLQLVEEQQVHAVPAAAAARTALARVMGYRDDAEATALARFDADLVRHQGIVRSIHERLFFRPLLEAFAAQPSPSAGADGRAMSPAAVETRLAAFGFRDAERTRQALAELTRGLTRSSRLMQQMLPLVLGWLSEAPDPDLGLLGLRTLASDRHRAARVVSTFRESPEAARRLCLLVATSRLLIDAFERHPDLIPDVGAAAALVPASRSDMVERAAAVARWRAETTEQRRGLRRLARAEWARVAARDVLALADLDATAVALSELGEAILEGALCTVADDAGLCVVAMGRFGGAELSYASDLDVLFVHAGTAAGDAAAAERAAESLLRLVNGATPSERLVFSLDPDLRPEGRQGPLARSLDGYRTYYDKWAGTWERQALLRARPVAGNAEVGARFSALVHEVVWGTPFTDEHARDIRRMKARVERERIPPGDDPQFHLKLGRGSLSDVEWTVQLLQLRHQIAEPGTMAALGRLAAAGVLDAADAGVLAEAYRFCERVRNRLFLVRGGPGDSLPSQPEQLARLARSLDTTATGLREEYRRVTRRARAVVERVFYGRG